MRLQEAQKLAGEIVSRLVPFCSAIEVAGSIRRKRSQPRDIDIVCIVQLPLSFTEELKNLAAGGHLSRGEKTQRLQYYKGAQVDFYYATPATWATLLLIRTGSKEHNIKLCSIAKQKGWKLHADGSGLFDGEGRRIAGDSEEGIFKALGLPYAPPEERG